ncbi:DgyrCDS11983 [Dimorphilus gyrociliatus]|uniref:DgyrCDS11983 n=1 Tax=Dimorphilus gyrociliatus TaxID=2664684 RepID=A0A7I8W6C9_9ANNE|nr:DgyrCDS11983 [Dimorphilus gyrociliatus]
MIFYRNGITLRIQDRKEDDSGIYTCKVFNVAGSRTKTVTVPRNKKPVVKPTDSSTAPTTEMVSISSISPSGLSPNARVEHCKIQSFCLNGGVCYNIPSIHMRFCRCKEDYVGYRCQFPFPEGMIGKIAEQQKLETDRVITRVILAGIVLLLIMVILLAFFMRCFHKSQRKRFMRYKQELNAKEPLVQNHNSLNIQYQTPTNVHSIGVQTDPSLDPSLLARQGNKYDEFNEDCIAESQDSTDKRQGIFFSP